MKDRGSEVRQRELQAPAFWKWIEAFNPPLQQHDGARLWRHASRQELQGPPSGEGELAQERPAEGLQRSSVVPRIRDEQDHVLHLTVTLLQRDPSLEGLDIAQSGLRFDRPTPSRPANHGIPRPKVWRSGYRHLGPPRKRRMDSPAQTLEQCKLRGVTKGPTGWVCTNGQLLPDRGQQFRRLDHGEVGRQTASHAADLFAR